MSRFSSAVPLFGGRAAQLQRLCERPQVNNYLHLHTDFGFESMLPPMRTHRKSRFQSPFSKKVKSWAESFALPCSCAAVSVKAVRRANGRKSYLELVLSAVCSYARFPRLCCAYTVISDGGRTWQKFLSRVRIFCHVLLFTHLRASACFCTQQKVLSLVKACR